jgi:hypothetical protein
MTETNTESLGSLFVGGDASLDVATLTDDGFQLAPASGNAPPATSFFQPAGCVTSTLDKANKTVTHVFNGCSGPFGLLHLTGTVTVEHNAPSASELDLTISASGFQINKATVDHWQATAKIVASGTTRTMTWDAQLSGKGARGEVFSRKNHKTIGWTLGAGCISVDGYSDGQWASVNLHTDVKAFQWCRGACPNASSEVTIKNVDSGKTIDLTFDGDATATFTSADGSKKEIQLACGG